MTAFERPDGKIVLVLLNKAEEPMTVNVRMQGMIGETLLYPESITTAILTK